MPTTSLCKDNMNDIDETQKPFALFGVEAEKRRADQLGLNCSWLIDKIDRIHAAMCPGQHGTWQQRAEQAVKAAESNRVDR